MTLKLNLKDCLSPQLQYRAEFSMNDTFPTTWPCLK